MRNIIKTIAAVIILSVVLLGITRLVKTGDPWELRFSRNDYGCADILITNKKLTVDGARVRTKTPVPPNFKEIALTARNGIEVPIGKVTFSDFTTLPGHLTILIGTHSVDIMQRALLIDGNEIAWQRAMEKPIELDSP